MARIHTDLSRVAISVAPSPATSGTSLGVTDANAAYLPDTYPFWAVLVPVNAAPTRANSEIVKVTAGSSSGGTTTYTIVRAQGTPVTTAKTVTTSFDIYDANSTEANIGLNSLIVNETPSGTVNGSNTAFDTASTYVAGSIQVYRDGQLMKGGGADYTETDSNTITFTTAPVTGSVLLVSYQHTVSTTGNADTVDGVHANDYGGTDGQLVADYGGWKKAPGSWTYASASTITVTTGAASVYGKGDRIRWKQGGAYKYGVIVAVADTLLTIAVNTDYTVASSAITDMYFSHEANPLGYPHWFNWTTSWGGFSTNPTGTFIYSIIGNMCSMYYSDSAAGTSNATSLTFTGPVAALKTATMAQVVFGKDNGSNLTTPSHLATTASSATITAYKSFAYASWTNTGGKDIYIGLFSYAF